MTYKLARLSVALVIAVSLANIGFARQDDSSKQSDSSKSKKKPKNSDVDNIGSRDINKGNILPLISLEKEIAIGQQLAAQIERQAKIVKDPVINEYVNRLEQNIVRNSDAKVPFTTKIIESDEINAFALPGGFTFVNTGLLLAADEEAEVAGVLAHETAHVAARHGAKAMSKETAVNLATIPLIIFGGYGAAGIGIQQAAGLAIPIAFLKFSRAQEAEADYLGTQYMYKAGYDPSALLTFFEKLQAKEATRPGSVSAVFRDHPPTGDRISSIKQEIETILPSKDQYVVTTSEFNNVKDRLVLYEKGKLAESTKKPGVIQRTPRTTAGRQPTPEPDSSNRRRVPAPQTQPDDRAPSDDSDAPPPLKRKN
jgi:predicted Zn-dependent protease